MEFGVTVERMNELEEKSLTSILLAMNVDSYYIFNLPKQYLSTLTLCRHSELFLPPWAIRTWDCGEGSRKSKISGRIIDLVSFNLVLLSFIGICLKLLYGHIYCHHM